MSSRLNLVVLAGLLLVLGAANFTIWEREQVIANGRPVLLQLRPVDPRSLMQGDYMALRYADELFPEPGSRSELPRRGAFIVKLDAGNVATFSRLDDGTQLGATETRLKYKLKDKSGSIRLGAETFFFEEGQASAYSGARYGVLHVDASGNSVLIGLADEERQIMFPQSP